MTSEADKFRSALNELYGCVPAEDRKWADGPMRVLEQYGRLLSDALNFQRAIEAKAFHFQHDRDQVAAAIKSVEEGLL